MRVSVIVPSYNSKRTIRACLEGILAQKANDYELIVVDDASTDDSLDIVRKYGRVNLVTLNENHGPPFARNAGARQSSGEILIFLDSDCFVTDPEWIGKHVARLEAGGPKSIVGGSVDADGPGWAGKAFTYNNWYVCHPRLSSLPWGVNHLQSTNISIFRGAFEELGGFDESLRAGEDVEFCVRAVRQGYALDYCNQILVHHQNRTSFRQFLKVNFDYGKTRIAMKHKGAYRASFLLQENPVLNVLLMLPLAALLTLRILLVWLPYGPKIFGYLPFVFLGQLMMVFGVFHSLVSRR